MIADLDLSNERPEEMPSHHEERAQVFNNDLFQLHSDNEIPTHHQNDFQDPSPIHYDSRKNMTDRDEADNLKWLENEMTQKDTLDLNYQAELRAQNDDFQFIGSSQNPGRLDDLLRDADFALRRSNDLAHKVTTEAKKMPPPSNYQYKTTTTTSADGTKTTSSYSSYKYSNMFRTGNLEENPEPQENNFAQHTPFDDYQEEQEQPLRASKNDSRPLTNSRVAYNLFPIQEDAEQGHETPRDRQRSHSGAFDQVQIETQTYNIDHHHHHRPNLADTVLNNVPTTVIGLGHNYQGQSGYQAEPINHQFLTDKEGLESKTRQEEILRHSRDSTAFNTNPVTGGYYETTVRTTTTTTPMVNPENIDKRIDDILKKHFGESADNSNLRLSNPNIRPSALNQKYSTASVTNYQSPFSSEFTSPAQANSALQIREYSITSPNLQPSQQLKTSGYIPNMDSRNIMLTSPGNPLVNLASPTSSVLSKERRAEIERELSHSQVQQRNLASPLSPERKAEIERELAQGQHKSLISPLSQERKAEIEREISGQSYQYTREPAFETTKSTNLRISHDLFARPAVSTTLKKSTNFAEPTTTYAPHSMYSSDIIPRNYWNDTPSTTAEALNRKTDKKFTSSLVQKYCNPFFQDTAAATSSNQRAMTSPGRSVIRYSPSAYSKVEVFQELVPQPSDEYNYHHEKPQSPHTYRSHDRSKEIIYSNIESAEPKYVPSPKMISPEISESPGVQDFDAHYEPRHHHSPSPQNLAFKAQNLQDDFTSPKQMNSPQQVVFKAQSLHDDFTSPKKMNSPGDYNLEYRSNLESGVKNDFIDFDEPFDEEDYPAGSPPYGKAAGGDIHTRDHHHHHHHHRQSPENLEEELENVNLRFDVQDSNKKVFHSPFSWKQEDHYVDFASTPDRNSEQNITAEKHAEIPVDPLVSGHETTPDRRMKKLTLKNRNSEERTHEKKNSEIHEDILEERPDKHSIRSGPEVKQRHKIFENKVFEQDKQLQEEVYNSQRLLQEMEKEQKDSEKHRKIIFGDMPQRKGKDLEILLDPLQNSDISPINAGGRTSKTEGNYSTHINSDRYQQDKPQQQQPPKPQFDLKFNKGSDETITDSLGRINSERFPYQLKNGVLDPTESFFDFENEHFVTTDTSIRRTANKSSMNSIPSVEVKTQVFQTPTETVIPVSKRSKKRKDLHGQIWIIQEPSAFQPGQGFLSHQTFKEHLVKVPVIAHCFRKFHDRTKDFPNNDN